MQGGSHRRRIRIRTAKRGKRLTPMTTSSIWTRRRRRLSTFTHFWNIDHLSCRAAQQNIGWPLGSFSSRCSKLYKFLRDRPLNKLFRLIMFDHRGLVFLRVTCRCSTPANMSLRPHSHRLSALPVL